MLRSDALGDEQMPDRVVVTAAQVGVGAGYVGVEKTRRDLTWAAAGSVVDAMATAHPGSPASTSAPRRHRFAFVGPK